MKVIGLTGGIGSGKSTVSKFLADMGARVIDADRVGHEAFEPDTDAYREVVESFGRAGWEVPPSRASMFCWAPLPPALAHIGSLEFSKQLLTHAGVAVAPGVGYGEDGEGFVRIAMVENEHRIRQAARNVKRYLQSMGVNVPTQVKAV